MRLVFFITFVVSSLILGAQNLEGTVFVGEKNGKATPLPNASIYYPKAKKGYTSNVEGEFSAPIPEGETVVIFRYSGLYADTLEIEGLENPVLVVMRDGKILKDVEIKAGRNGYSYQRFNARDGHIMHEGELRKAACCNLSESFETNPSIDANYTDAVTGTKQIQMLGLAGKYVQIMQDNIPMVRGLSTTYGLEFIPGAWVNSIQVSKGAGSVVNGYESMTGQINVGMKNPETGEPFHLNLYTNTALRNELNLHTTRFVTSKWKSTFLIHGKYANRKMDMNGDGFIDSPLSNTLVVQNQWNYLGRDLHMELGGSYVYFNNQAGQFAQSMNHSEGEMIDYLHYQILDNPYRVNNFSGKWNAFAKIGYLFPNHEYKSAALQLNASSHTQLSQFDWRVYNGIQNSGYANFIFQNYIADREDHIFKTGASIVYDDYSERTRRIENSDTIYTWTEIVPGAYFEYTKQDEKFGVIAGIRADYHNMYGAFVTPRLNARYAITEKLGFKIAAGMGRRTPNLFMENIGALASSRTFQIESSNSYGAYGLDQEVAQNYGASLNYTFKINKKEGSFNSDFYHTRFSNQIVADYDFDSRSLHLYNLDGNSVSNSWQAELSINPTKRFEVRTAYRWLDVQTQYKDGVLQQPLTAKHRGFLNLAKESRPNKEKSHWKFDLTTHLVGKQRIPQTLDKPTEYQVAQESDPFVQLNGQITYVYKKKWEFYVGGENLTNYRISNPIISADNPYGEDFDASLVWGPIFGRMAYVGLRFTIKE